MNKLRECPFCGRAGEVVVGEHSFIDVKIRCTNCFAEGPLFDEDDEKRKNVNAAISHWNTRVTNDNLDSINYLSGE